MSSKSLQGGSIRILWDASDSVEVSITNTSGAPVAFTVNGSAVSFPYTMSSSTTFATDQSGRYEVSVKHHGIEVANTPDGTRFVNVRGGSQEVFSPTEDGATTAKFMADLHTSLASTYVLRGYRELEALSRDMANVQKFDRHTLATGCSVGTWSAGGAASAITSGVDVNAIASNLPNTAKFTFLRGKPVQRGASFPDNATLKMEGLGGNGLWTTTELCPMIVFRHSGATQFEVRLQGRGAMQTRLRIRVDGRWIQYSPIQGPPSGGQQHRLMVTLPDTGEHEIALDFAGFMAWFRGITVAPAATVKKSWVTSPRLIVVGDSQTEGANGVFDDIGNPLGFAPEVARLLGIDDAWISGIGSTGWLAKGGGSRPNVRERLQTDVIDPAPDWVHFAMAQNDAAYTYAGVRAEVEYAIGQIQTQLPNTVITFQSQFHPNEGNGLVIRDAIKDAADAAGLLFVDMTGWLTGDGYQGGETGNGNKDQFVSTDSSHLSPEGHLVAGRMIAAALRRRTSWPGV